MNLNPVGWASSSLRLVARLFNSGVNSAVPVTAISEAPIGVANADIALVAKGTGALLAQVPDGTITGGNKRGANAVDWQVVRSDRTYVASGLNSVIGGGTENLASGQLSTVSGGRFNFASATRTAVGGGEFNTASSNYSFVGGGQSNTAQTNTHATVCGGSSSAATGLNSFVGGGASNVAGQQYSCVVGGQSNSSSASWGFIGGGFNNVVSNSYSTTVGGYQNSASGDYSFISGGRRGTTRSIIGYQVFPACNVPIADAAGVTQSALLLLARQTTDATATVLTSNTTAAGTTNQVILPNNSAYSFSGEVIAGVTGAGNTARWTINGAIKRGANAASTAMVGTATVTMTHNDAGAAAWAVAVTADTTNGGIKVEVTGAASTTIRWVCKINTTEMTY
jgi:hypothetical protein